jgi:hypothetical protein
VSQWFVLALEKMQVKNIHLSEQALTTGHSMTQVTLLIILQKDKVFISN